MEIVYHVGAHGTDHERIARILLRNREELWEHGVEIPSPGRYRGVFGEAISALKGGPAPAEMQAMLLDALVDSDRGSRVILSQSGFLGMPQRAVGRTGLYPRGPNRLAGLSNLFPDNVVEFFVSIMHPARMVVELVRMTTGRYETLMGGIDPATLRWAPVIRNILQAVPERDIVVFAQEDLPFTLPEVLRRMAALTAGIEMKGEMDLLTELLPQAALTALQASMAEDREMTIPRRRDLVENALSQAEPAAFEADIALPGWSQSLIDELSDSYAEDLAEIAALPGVEFIAA